ncbi:MAG: CPA2 family monovalent cation:H+ antiporter-2 [Cryomorphaceae bacterium]
MIIKLGSLDVLAAGGAVPPIFVLLTLVLSSVVVVSLLCSRLKQSLLIGYFVCGLILSNSGILGWAGVGETELIDNLSEIGIVLLLFTLGIEFSVKELKALRRPALLGGGLQVGLCIIIAMGVGMMLGLGWQSSLLLGFMVCLSSTAVSLKTFQDLGLPESPQARVTLGMAVFQDLMTILFMVLLPAIVSDSSDSGGDLVYALLKGLGFTAFLVVISRFGLPQMLDAVAKSRSRELFTVTVIGLCAAVALLSGVLGLSPALGAFAAGVVVSESIYSHRVLSDILPFKDLFLTIFFVSVGLLIDLELVMKEWPLVLLITVVLVVVKGGIVYVAARLSGLQSSRSLVVAAALCSMGEFSIVVLNRSMDLQVFDARIEQLILASTALSMALVPTLMKLGVSFCRRRSYRSVNPSKNKKGRGKKESKWEHEIGVIGKIEDLHDHVIICGYGPVGQNLHKNLQSLHIPVVILEMNPMTVKHLIGEGHLALFADARDREGLKAARIEDARGLAVTFPDKPISLAIVHTAREMKETLLLYVRCKFRADLADFEEARIDHVLLDEEQSGRAMIKRVMLSYSEEFDESWM